MTHKNVLSIGNYVSVAALAMVVTILSSQLLAQISAEFVSTPPNGEGFLWDVDILTANDAWAVGDEWVYYNQFSYDRHSLIIRWDGTEWNRTPSPTPSVYVGGGTTVTLYDVVGLNAEEAWAVGTYETQHPVDNFLGFQTIAMKWDGSSWQVTPTPTTQAGMTGASLHSVVANSSNDVYAAGQIVDPEDGNVIQWVGYAVHWNGSQWSALPLAPPEGFRNEFRDMAAIDENSMIMVGGHSGNTSGARDQPYVAIWDGDWEITEVPVPAGQNFLESVVVVAPDDIWIAGTNDPFESGYRPLFIHYNGSNWSVVDVPEFNHYGGSIRGLTAAGGDRLYASGSFAPSQGDFNRPLLMEYDGSQWIQAPTDPNGPVGGTLFAVYSDLENETWAVGIQNGSRTHALRLTENTPLMGDINRDGFVNLVDVAPFVELLSTSAFQAEADLNQDGSVDLLDVQPFVDTISN